MPDGRTTHDTSDVVELITRMGEALQSSRGIDSILSDIIELVMEIMQVDACSVYLYENDVLRLKATRGMELPEGDAVDIALGEGISGMTGLQRKPFSIRDLSTEYVWNQRSLPETGSMLSVPMLESDKLVGVLNVLTTEIYEFTETDKKFAVFIAAQLVGAIRNAQLYDEVVRGFREMATIQQVSQIVNSVLDLGELLPTIAKTCAEHISARGCVLRLHDEKDDTLVIMGEYGVPERHTVRRRLPPGEGVAGKVFVSGLPVIRKGLPMERPEDGSALEDILDSIISVPLAVKNKVIGTLSVFDKMAPFSDKPARFEDEDVGLVSMVGVQVAMAIENARLFAHAVDVTSEKDRKIGELSLLLEITNIMRSSLDIEELLYIILTSVTMGEGLGFNRAALFMLDSNGGVLQGKMAVGPLSADEAHKHWTAIAPVGNSLPEKVREWGQFNMTAGFRIDRAIKSATIPVLPEKGILARTVIEMRTFNLQNYSSPENSEDAVLGEANFRSFATVPLLVKDRVLGVIVVDNLVNRLPITEADVRFLQLFANQAAIAIEMSRVYKNLEQMNRRLVDARDLLVRTKTLATLGEFSAGVAHELRNPLVSIGGFAKRLAKKLDGETSEARYARIIAREVEGMEKILNQILDFVGGARPDFTRVDIVHLLEQVFMLFNDALIEENITLTTKYDPKVQFINVDEVQMRQLFINLIKNGIEAMKGMGGGELKITTTLVENGEGGVGFEISDTGVGISAEDLGHVFDPFFTKKDTGTGLGLPMCSRIVETNHGGRIFIDSRKGRGANILIWLPPEVTILETPEGQ